MVKDKSEKAAVKCTLRVKEVAQELGVSIWLIYKLCRAGRIRSERHGTGRGTIRIRREALDVYWFSVESRKYFKR